MKKIIKLILSLTILLGIASPLTGCSKESEETIITNGQWLQVLTNEFGMFSYQSDEPYIKTINNSNEYFDAVQIAYEWGVIDGSELVLSDPATKGFIAQTLVKTVGFYDVENKTMDEIVQFALDNKYVSFEDKGKFDYKRNVTQQEALDSLEFSKMIWINRPVPENKEDVEYADNVTDMNKLGLFASDIEYNSETNQVKLPAKYAEDIEEGSIYIIPNNNGLGRIALKADQIEIIDDYVIITNKAATFEEVVEELDISGRIVANFDESPIIDGLGNVTKPSGSIEGTVATTNLNINNLGSNSENVDFEQLASGKGSSFSFKTDGLEIKGNASGSSISFSIKGDSKLSGGGQVHVEKEYAIENISVDYDCDAYVHWDWFNSEVRVNNAYIKANYKIVDRTYLSYTHEIEGHFAPKYSNGNGKFPSNLSRAILKDADAKGAKTIKIATVPMLNAYAIRVDLEVKVKIYFNGEIELIVTTNNTSGMEYKGGNNLRFIQESQKETNLNIKANIEATLYAGFVLKFLTYDIAGVGAEVGLGVEVSNTVNLVSSKNVLTDRIIVGGNSKVVDSYMDQLSGMSYINKKEETDQLHTEICLDFRTYFIYKTLIDTNTVIGKFYAKKDIQTEFVLFDKDNNTIDLLSFHMEDGNRVGQCTRKYDIEDDELSEELEDENSTINNQVGSEYIDIDTYFVNLLVNEITRIKVTSIPFGYESQDLVFGSEDSSIATIDANGNITGISEGTTTVFAMTKDGNIRVNCSVVVSSITQPDFTPLDIKGL